VSAADGKHRELSPTHGENETKRMAKISLVDLEVSYCVGVRDAERAQPQRLLLTVEMELDTASAAARDEITATIDYFAVAQRLLAFGKGRSWKLIETLGSNIADMILADFRPDSVTVEVKKFVIPEARYVSVSLTKTAAC
jgi:7,8-dihydroneopterin aldolase/epimerase/oxygenase